MGIISFEFLKKLSLFMNRIEGNATSYIIERHFLSLVILPCLSSLLDCRIQRLKLMNRKSKQIPGCLEPSASVEDPCKKIALFQKLGFNFTWSICPARPCKAEEAPRHQHFPLLLSLLHPTWPFLTTGKVITRREALLLCSFTTSEMRRWK